MLGALLSAPSLLYAQWTVVAVPSKANFRSVHLSDEHHGWIGGARGTVLKTDNGGTVWEKVSPPDSDSLDFRSVYGFPGGRNAVAMSIGESEKGHARIYFTENGGMSWQLAYQTTRPGVFLNCLDFWDNQNGLCMGDPVMGKFLLLRTRNGGKSWEEVSQENLPSAMEGEVAFAASGSTLALGVNGQAFIGTGGVNRARVLRSSDFGNSWSAVETPIKGGASSGIFGLHFYDPLHGVALGGDYVDYRGSYVNIAYTFDGGLTWSARETNLFPGLKESAAVCNSQFLFVVGHSGSAYSDDWGKTWTSIDLMPYHAVSFFGKTGVAVGVDGLVGKWE